MNVIFCGGVRLTWELNGPAAGAPSPFLVLPTRLALAHTRLIFPLPFKVLGKPTPRWTSCPSLTSLAVRPEWPIAA